ncbi:MAG: TM0106 family RecB-like putative nuclease, partial [bacterium]|nr:TM0106 family RecB-like putative nuclease [bacterium]
MGSIMKRLTATDYFKFFHCPHWAFYDWHATEEEKKLKREQTEEEKQRQEDGVLHEKAVVKSMFSEENLLEMEERPANMEEAFQKTLEAMQAGANFIYQGTLIDGDWIGRPDILEKRAGNSNLGNWHYMPVDVKSSQEIKKYQKFQLTFYAILLERIQGRMPSEGAIVNIDHHRLPYRIEESLSEFTEVTEKIEEVRQGERPEPVLRKSCFDVGLWGMACEKLARETDDISQLYNISVRLLEALRSVGIRTVTDASEMDPENIEVKSDGRLTLRMLLRAKLQALSLKFGTVFIRSAVDLPVDGLEIHFDIESSPGRDMDYLYGFLIRQTQEAELGTQDVYKAFVARDENGEAGMWKEFLAWVETLPEKYVIYHYATYEKARLSVLSKRHGGSEALDRFRENMIDLSEMVSSSAVFPLYFYGLKQIAPFLGFEWSSHVKSGGASVGAFEKYLETKNEELMDDLLTYNEDDVRATAVLKDWLVSYAKNETSYPTPYPWSP